MEKYNGLAMVFHWGVGLLMIGLLGVGLIMVDMPKPDKYAFYGWHKALGIIALALVTLRFIWRQIKRPPALPDSMPRYQKIVSEAAHIALYAMMFLMPILGWMMSSAGGHPIMIGNFEVPPIVEKNEALGAWAHDMHEIGGWVLITLIVLHVLAALYHHFVQKDGILLRMLPGKRAN